MPREVTQHVACFREVYFPCTFGCEIRPSFSLTGFCAILASWWVLFYDPFSCFWNLVFSLIYSAFYNIIITLFYFDAHIFFCGAQQLIFFRQVLSIALDILEFTRQTRMTVNPEISLPLHTQHKHRDEFIRWYIAIMQRLEDNMWMLNLFLIYGFQQLKYSFLHSGQWYHVHITKLEENFHNKIHEKFDIFSMTGSWNVNM